MKITLPPNINGDSALAQIKILLNNQSKNSKSNSSQPSQRTTIMF